MQPPRESHGSAGAQKVQEREMEELRVDVNHYQPTYNRCYAEGGLLSPKHDHCAPASESEQPVCKLVVLALLPLLHTPSRPLRNACATVGSTQILRHAIAKRGTVQDERHRHLAHVASAMVQQREQQPAPGATTQRELLRAPLTVNIGTRRLPCIRFQGRQI